MGKKPQKKIGEMRSRGIFKWQIVDTQVQILKNSWFQGLNVFFLMN